MTPAELARSCAEVLVAEVDRHGALSQTFAERYVRGAIERAIDDLVTVKAGPAPIATEAAIERARDALLGAFYVPDSPMNVSTIERTLRGLVDQVAGPMPAEIRHVYQGELGKVSSKLAHTTQGVSLEIDVQRPLHPGDTFEDAGRMANEVWESLYRDGAERAARLGLTLGPKPKSEGGK